MLLGEGPAAIPRGASLIDAVAALAVPDSIPASLLTRRPDIVQAERTYAASVARIGVADAARWPTFNIVGSYGSQAGVPDNLFGSQTNVYQALDRTLIPIVRQREGSRAPRRRRARGRSRRGHRTKAIALNALREANDALVAVHTARDEAVGEATQANGASSGARSRDDPLSSRIVDVPRFARCAAELVQRGAGDEPGAVRRADRGSAVVQGARRELGDDGAALTRDRAV